MKKRYAAVGTGRRAQMAFRMNWAKDKYDEYKASMTVSETHTQEWITKSRYLAVGRIAWKFGGGKAGWRAALNHCGKALQIGEPMYEYDSSAEILLFLWGEKGFNDGFKIEWSKHQEWSSQTAAAQAARDLISINKTM